MNNKHFFLFLFWFFCHSSLNALPIDKLKDIYNNPKNYPNYVLISAHRGYWKDYPENSLPAIQKAIELGADMVEIDVTISADGYSYLMHDWGLDRLTDGHGLIKVRKGGIFSFPRDWNSLKNLKLKNPNSTSISTLGFPLLRDILLLCKNKVLVSIDKADDMIPEMYSLVKELGMIDQVTFKTKIQAFPTPESLEKLFLNKEDKENILKMYTPTIFDEYYDSEPDIIAKMTAFIEKGCPGFEMIYFKDNAAMLTKPLTYKEKRYSNGIQWLRDINKNVIQFPEWPENEKGNWSPGSFKWRDIDLEGGDRRSDWDWLTKPEHCPDVIISDRLEILFDYLKTIGKRNLNN